MGHLSIKVFELGPFATNCYLVSDGGEGFVVDASYEPEAIVDAARGAGVKVTDIVLTHAHCDHIAGLDVLRRLMPDAKVWVHSLEAEWLGKPQLNLSAFLGELVSVRAADAILKPGTMFRGAGREWNILHLPGHSPGSIGLYSAADGLVISGDALFAGSIGRTDFPNADFETLAASIRQRLYTLPEETRVFPGHGPATTVGREKRSNQFVRG